METWDRQLLAFIVAYKEIIGGVVAFLLLWIIIRRFFARFRPFRAASTDNGSVWVSRATVLNLIRSACAEIEGGSVKRVQCINKRRLLLLKLYISLDVNQSFEVSSMRFQEAAKNAVTHCLGALKAVRVDVVLDGVKGDFIEKPKSAVSTDLSASISKNKPDVASENFSTDSSKVGDDVKSEED